MKKIKITRRKALAGLGTLAAAAPVVAQAPKLIGEPPGRIAPREDLVNILEFEGVAERKLAPAVYATIAGGDRSYFERITFRPRMMVPTTNLDLTTELFGEKMFAPILVGPTARQQDFHPDGELATVRGASAARTVMVISGESSYPLEKIAAEAGTTLWYQAFPDADKGRLQQALKLGCKAVVITVGTPYRNVSGAMSPARLARMTNSPVDWNLIDRMRQGIGVPVILKGVMTPDEANEAVKRGIQGIVASNYGGLLTKGTAPAIEMLPSIVDAVGGRIPVLVDGGFRRGSDIFKALALGATAVLLGRPPLWGLAAYGADGVRSVLEMLQTEVGRDMCQCGKPNVKAIDRTVVKIHDA